MSWRSWLGACVISTCAQQGPSPRTDCQHTVDVDACQGSVAVASCLVAVRDRLDVAGERCESVWQQQRSEAAAVAGALDAHKRRDGEALERWGRRASETVQGARILHYVGELRQCRDD